MSCNDFYFCTPYSSLYSKHLFGFLLPPPYPVINWSNRERINHATVFATSTISSQGSASLFHELICSRHLTHTHTYLRTYLCSVGKSNLTYHTVYDKFNSGDPGQNGIWVKFLIKSTNSVIKMT